MDARMNNPGPARKLQSEEGKCDLSPLGNNKIVILDEATSSLTHSMETRLTSALASHFRSSTVITITHRVHKALYMDKVLVMDHGKVREFDAPNRLAENRQGS